MKNLSTLIGGRTVGVVGVGQWGQRLVNTLQPHTPNPVLQSDPPRAEEEREFPHIPLSDLTRQSDIIFLSTDLTAIPNILQEIRTQLRAHQVIIDIASSKRAFLPTLREIDASERAIVGSIHPMTRADIPSLRGQNGIVCTVSERSQEAEEIGEALFKDQEMIVHRMRLEEHDRMMDQLQGKPHFFQVAACASMARSLEKGTMAGLEKIGSPNFQLFAMSVGRGALLDPDLQADIITSMASSPEGRSDLEQIIRMQRTILDLALHDAALQGTDRFQRERQLPAFIKHMRETLDPTGTWREHMRKQTDTIIVRLANIKKRCMRLTAKKDTPGMLKLVCEILERHGIDLNAIDSMPTKDFPKGMVFELGHKDGAPIDMHQLEQDLDAIDVILQKEEPNQ